MNIWICRIKALRSDKKKRVKRKRKENQIIEVLNQVMGKGGICIHYTLLVVSKGVTAGRDFDPLVCLFCFIFSSSLFPFRSHLSVFGGSAGRGD